MRKRVKNLGSRQIINFGGLLSNIGHMIMGIRDPVLMQKMLNQHQKTGYPIHLFELSTFGFDYADLGADRLEGWSIPNSDEFPNMIDDETLIKSNIDHFYYDHVREEAKELYVEALSLLPTPQLKVAV